MLVGEEGAREARELELRLAALTQLRGTAKVELCFLPCSRRWVSRSASGEGLLLHGGGRFLETTLRQSHIADARSGVGEVMLPGRVARVPLGEAAADEATGDDPRALDTTHGSRAS